jgi:hypothetical protein
LWNDTDEDRNHRSKRENMKALILKMGTTQAMKVHTVEMTATGRWNMTCFSSAL